jgi:hypothetical protein
MHIHAWLLPRTTSTARSSMVPRPNPSLCSNTAGGSISNLASKSDERTEHREVCPVQPSHFKWARGLRVRSISAHAVRSRPPERHGHAGRHGLNVVPPSRGDVQHQPLLQAALEPLRARKPRIPIQVWGAHVNAAAVCREARLEGVQVWSFRGRVEADTFHASHLAEEVVVGVCVEGGHGARGADPGVDAVHLTLPKGAVLWRLHNGYTFRIAHVTFLNFSQSFTGLSGLFAGDESQPIARWSCKWSAHITKRYSKSRAESSDPPGSSDEACRSGA